MNINELNAKAEAAYEAHKVSFKAYLENGGSFVPNDGASFELDGVVYYCLVSNGNANGRSRNAYRYNYKINGKRCKAAEIVEGLR